MEYTISEIIDIALGLEETGYKFYTACAENFNDEEVRDVFSFLAKEELVHLATFRDLLKDGGKVSGVFTDEYYLYMKSIGGGRIFHEKEINFENFLDSIKTPSDAIRKAFLDEKEAILFYSEMKNLFKGDPETTDILDRIIEEERKHVLVLADLIDKIQLAE